MCGSGLLMSKQGQLNGHRSTAGVRCLATLALLSALANCAWSAEPSLTRQKTERFDRDPRWDGKQNRSAPPRPPLVQREFGYSKSQHAGRAAGEIGGKVSQSIRPAYYGKVLPTSTLEEPLSASGSLSIVEAQAIMGWHTQGNLYVGWFSSDVNDLIWRPRNFIGFRLQSSNEPDGALVELTYGTHAWQAGGMFVNAAGGGQERLVRELKSSALLRIPPNGAKHAWSYLYDPAAANGAGEIIFSFDGVESRLPLQSALRKVGASFNRFGLFAPRIPGRHIVAYFDDLTLNGRPQDFGSDPQWEGVGNRERFRDDAQYGHNDFGFRPSHHAGGEAGEMGGRFFSCNPGEDEFKAYYGDRVGKLTFNHRLSARGKFTAREFSTDSSFALGWFNAKKQGWPLENFVGVYFDSLSSDGRIAAPLYGTSQGNKREGGAFLIFEPGQQYDWALEYDPAAADGRGAITFTLASKSVTLPLNDGDKARGALLDRFGVFNLQWANSKWCEVYLDDLSYTVGVDIP
jgi:hypothetical protein